MAHQFNSFAAAIAAPTALLLILAALGGSAASDLNVKFPEQPLTNRRHLRATGSQASKGTPQRKVTKDTYKTKGDYFNLNADKSDENGFSYLYVGAFNRAIKSSNPADAPLQNHVMFSYYTCQRVAGASQCPGDFTYDCTDIYGNTTITSAQFSLDSKLNSVVSVDFIASKSVPGSTTPEPVAVSILLNVACNPASITKFSTSCSSSTQSFGTPALRIRSESKADTTSCAIDRAGVTGTITVDSIPMLPFFQNTDGYASAETGKTKDSTLYFQKNPVV